VDEAWLGSAERPACRLERISIGGSSIAYVLLGCAPSAGPEGVTLHLSLLPRRVRPEAPAASLSSTPAVEDLDGADAAFVEEVMERLRGRVTADLLARLVRPPALQPGEQSAAAPEAPGVAHPSTSPGASIARARGGSGRAVLALLALLFGLVLPVAWERAGAGLREGWSRLRAGAARAGVCALSLACLLPSVIWVVAPGVGAVVVAPAEQEHTYVSVLFWLALTFVAAAPVAACVAWVAGRSAGAGGAVSEPKTAGLRLDAALCAAVALWAAFVHRFLTETNLLMPAIGQTRLLRSQGEQGHTGVRVLVEAFLPSSQSSELMPAVAVVAVIASLAPPLVFVVARLLSMKRAPAALAGLALACWPVHAALSQSELTAFSSVSLVLMATALVGARRPVWVGAGAVLLAFALWTRPEAALHFIPAAILLSRLPISTLLSAPVWPCLAVLAHSAFVHTFALLGWPTGARWFSVMVGHRHEADHWAAGLFDAMLGSGTLLPWWILAPAFVGVIFTSRGVREIAAAGLVAGIGSVLLGWVSGNDGLLNALRYGAFAFPWVALLTGQGFFAVARGVGWARAHVAPKRPELARGGRRGVLAGAALVIVGTGLAHHEYLGRAYGPVVERAQAAELLRRLPPDCGLLVPDDLNEAKGGRTEAISEHYRQLAAEVVPGRRVLGVTELLDHLRRGGAPGAAPWCYLRGAFCDHAFRLDIPSQSCAAFEEEHELELLSSVTIPYVSPRAVVAPEAGWKAPVVVEQPIGLHRVSAR